MSNGKSKSKKSKKSKTKSSKSNKSKKSKSNQRRHLHHHHKHHHHHHHRSAKSHGPKISSRASSNRRRSNKQSSRAIDSNVHRFVLKGKMLPKGSDSMISPSVLLPDQMTTIYTVPNEHFKTEKDVVDYNGYTILEQIGKGGFAVVFKAKENKSGRMCACKTVKITSEDNILEMKNELFIMEMVDNPFAIRLYLHFLVNQTLFIFMQLADAGCFGKMLEKDGVLSEKESAFYFAQMCCGTLHMHEKNIAHRDIKPANFLMAEHPNGKKVILISDYGLSRVVHRDGSKPVLYTTQCGTPAYMAPEILSGDPYNCYLIDVWSLGCTLYAMLNLMTPFNVDQDDYGVNDMLEGKWDFSDDMKDKPSDSLCSVMKGMLEPDPNRRLTLKEVTQHEWLAKEYQDVGKMEPVGSSKKK